MAKHLPKQSNTYFTARPRVVQHLMECGYTPTIVPNPYAPDKMAWTFPRSPELMNVVNTYLKDAAEENINGKD